MSKYSFSMKFILICSIFCCLTFGTGMLWAQETRVIETTKVTKVKKPMRVSTTIVATDPAATLRAQIEKCGQSCMMGGSGKITSGEGTTLDYDCDENGNCACFGSSDCVAMAPICAEGTLGCNDQGCICEEGDG